MKKILIALAVVSGAFSAPAVAAGYGNTQPNFGLNCYVSFSPFKFILHVPCRAGDGYFRLPWE